MADLNKVRDPNFKEYAYTARELVQVYRSRSGKTRGPKLLLGEWVKIIEEDGKIPKSGRVHVAFRGGKGYVERDDLSRQRQLEVFFIDVDQGDAILIQTPNDRRVLIDGGQTGDAYEFILNKYRLDKKDHYVDFEAVVATHSDQDHTLGLLKILRDPRIAVKRLYHNGLFRRSDASKDPGPHDGDRVFGVTDRPSRTGLTSLMRRFLEAADTAKKNLLPVTKKMKTVPRWKGRVGLPAGGFVFKRLDAADRFLPPFSDRSSGMVIEVLWPKARRTQGKLYYPWYDSAGHTVNGNSITLRVVHGKNSILLTGDLNEPSMDDLVARYGDALRAHVYKAAHHGSQHFSVDFLRHVKPNAAVISSGDSKYDQHGHPRAVLLGTIVRHSRRREPAVFSTELAACFRKLPKAQQKLFREGKGRMYERAIKGIVHLRSDGRRLCLGTVHGRRPSDDPQANIMWKWDVWPRLDH